MRFYLLQLSAAILLNCSATVLVAAEEIPISQLQGAGDASDHLGQQVETSGVVTLILANSGGGFFVQSKGDGNSATSDALFVEPAPGSPPPAVGSWVRLGGELAEVKGRTTLLNSRIREQKAGDLPQVTELQIQDFSGLESAEGMRIRLGGDWYINDVYQLGRYGSAILSSAPREYTSGSYGEFESQPASVNIVMDDGSLQQNPSLIRWLRPGSTVRVGDRIQNPEGILDFVAGQWHLHVVETQELIQDNPRQPAPAKEHDGLRVVSYNVLNYFTSLEERGASSDAEFTRQQSKLVAALKSLDGDVYALIEMENNGAEAVADLVAALNEATQGGYKAVADPYEGLGSDAIKVAFVYRDSSIELVGEAVADYADVHHRPPVAATFKSRKDGEVFNLIVNHFKSKGCRGVPEDDRDRGQGCWNHLRTQQAEAMLKFAADVIRESGDADMLILGDLNAYLEEDPVRTIEEGGFRNLLRRIAFEDRYTYVYKGDSGALDHALASKSMEAYIAGIHIWHLNSDEAKLLDYNLEHRSPMYFRPDPYRSSDHDPVVIDLSIGN